MTAYITSHIEDVSVYLTNKCNFNCTYCDRDYIDLSVGGQHMSSNNIPQLMSFLAEVFGNNYTPKMLSFHGGETLIHTKLIDQILDEFFREFPTTLCSIFIQTNGSLVEKHKWFFEKWNDRLQISISYDFLYQNINRTSFDIDRALEVLNECGIKYIQFQCVLPLDDPKVFSLDSVRAITSLCYRHGVSSINLIPLRHYRGEDKFKVLIDEIPLDEFFRSFIQFIELLYVLKLHVVVDGQSKGIDKHYFSNHKQMILSPDGYIYPEYDFLEYQQAEMRVGKWKPINGDSSIELYQDAINEDDRILPSCRKCRSRTGCGLKFFYKMWSKVPQGNCAIFYNMVEYAIHYSQKLNTKANLREWTDV